MRVLHIIRSLEDQRALETAQAHAQEHQVTLVLMQDAVLGHSSWQGEIYACREDLEARGLEGATNAVDYDGLVRMIFGHDRVIMW